VEKSRFYRFFERKFGKTTANLGKSRIFAKNFMKNVMDTMTKGMLTPCDIDEEGRYYFVRKSIDAYRHANDAVSECDGMIMFYD
jgi:hypothetical protein